MKKMILFLQLVAVTVWAGSAPQPTSRLDPLDRARAAVETRLAAQTMLRDTSVTAGWVTNERQITVSFRSVQQSPAENARDVYGLIWQALSKDGGFDAVDRIVLVVRGAGPRPYEVNCPSKVVQESSGYMSEALMTRGCTLDGGNHAALEFRQMRVSQMNRL